MEKSEKSHATPEIKTSSPETSNITTEKGFKAIDLTSPTDSGTSGSSKKVPRLTPDNIIALQRTYGNQAVQRLIKQTVQRVGPTTDQNKAAQNIKTKFNAAYDSTTVEVNKLYDDTRFNKDIRDKQVTDALKNTVRPYVEKAAENIIAASVKNHLDDDPDLTSEIENRAGKVGDDAKKSIDDQQKNRVGKPTKKDEYLDLVSNKKAKKLGSEKGKKALAHQLRKGIGETAAKKVIDANIKTEIDTAVEDTKPPIQNMVDKKVSDFKKKNTKEAIKELAQLQTQNNEVDSKTGVFATLDDSKDDISKVLADLEQLQTTGENKMDYIKALVKAVDAVAKSAAGGEARDQRRPAARKIEALLKKDQSLRQTIKKAAKTKATELLTNPQNSKDLQGIEDNIIKRKMEGNISSNFDWIGHLIDMEVPREGSRGILEVTLSVPVYKGVFVQVRVLGDVKREDGKIKMNAEASFGAGAGFGASGLKAKAVGELGGRLEIETDKGGIGAMRLLSYGLYRKGRESSGTPDVIIDGLWGMGGESGKSAYEEAEAWGLMMEEGMGGSDFVDLGLMAVAQAGVNATVAKAQMRAMLFSGKRYNKEYIEHKRKERQGKKKGGDHKEKAYNTLVGGQGRQKSVGKNIMLFEFYGRGEVGAGSLLGVGGDLKGKLYFEPSKLKTKSSRFTKKELEMSALLKVPSAMVSTEDIVKGLIVWLPAAMKFSIDATLSAERANTSEETSRTETNTAQAIGQGVGTAHQAATLAAWEAVNLSTGAMHSTLSSVLSTILGASTTLKLILKITDSRDKPLEVNVYVDVIQGINASIGAEGTAPSAKVRFDKSERLINFKLAPAFEVVGLR